MYKAKKLCALLCVLLAVCAAAFAVSRYEEKKEQIKSSGEVILEIAADDVTALSWENESGAFSFTKGEKWVYGADSAFPVDADKINALLAQFEEFSAAFTIEDAEDVSLGGESYTFVRTAPEDGSGEDPVWTYNGEEFDVYDLKTALRAVSAAGFTDEAPSGQEEISLTVYLDNADFPSFTLTLYRYNGENCIAAVDGKAAAFVSRSQTVDLIEAVNRLTLGS